MKRYLQIIRLTAKLLLVVVVAVLVTGLLTAKPSLLSPAELPAYRWLHTRLAPLLFVPLVFIHAGSGLLLMLGRSKRFNRPALRRGVMAAWTAVGLVVAVLLFVEPAEPDLSAFELVEPAVTRATTGAGGGAGAGGGPGASAGTAGSGGSAAAGRALAGSAGSGSVGVPSAPSASAPVAVPRPLATESSVGPTQLPAAKASSAGAPTVAPSATTVSAPTASASALSGPQLIGKRCTGCHGLDVIVAEKRTTAEWSAIVDQMIGYGAQLTPAERSLIMRYLPRKSVAR